ncbi:unnamed protein product [Closterium sp. Naga37s-1]|nr:unnamed protein product [Closterium sp. Naga37s-1]
MPPPCVPPPCVPPPCVPPPCVPPPCVPPPCVPPPCVPPLCVPPLCVPPLCVPPLCVPPLCVPPLCVPPLCVPPLCVPPLCVPPLCVPPLSYLWHGIMSPSCFAPQLFSYSHYASSIMPMQELAAHKEEVDELRHMLIAVKGELAAVKGELSVVKGELSVVKGELAEHKNAMAEKVVESSRASDGTGLRGKSRTRKQEITANLAREEDRGREVQELNQPHATEDLAASKEGLKKRILKLNVALQIKQSKGDQKMAWKVCVE